MTDSCFGPFAVFEIASTKRTDEKKERREEGKAGQTERDSSLLKGPVPLEEL